MKTSVFCSFKVEGTHSWPSCHLKEVEYLKHPHRHMFGVKCWKTVLHDDRDVEFIALSHEVKRFLAERFADGNGVLCFAEMSCEAIAIQLMERFGLSRCVVDEDGENGAEVVA